MIISLVIWDTQEDSLVSFNGQKEEEYFTALKDLFIHDGYTLYGGYTDFNCIYFFFFR